MAVRPEYKHMLLAMILVFQSTIVGSAQHGDRLAGRPTH
jgi:hypothetical protein